MLEFLYKYKYIYKMTHFKCQKKKKRKKKDSCKKKKKKNYGKKRETPVRTLLLFSFKKDHKLEFFFFKGLTLGFKKEKKKDSRKN